MYSVVTSWPHAGVVRMRWNLGSYMKGNTHVRLTVSSISGVPMRSRASGITRGTRLGGTGSVA